jgi:hypothetical protein
VPLLVCPQDPVEGINDRRGASGYLDASLALRHLDALYGIPHSHVYRHGEGQVVGSLPAQAQSSILCRLDEAGKLGLAQVDLEEPVQLPAGGRLGDMQEVVGGRVSALPAVDGCGSTLSGSQEEAMRRRVKVRPPKPPSNCLSRCEQCGHEEQIPTDVLAYFDTVDPGTPEAPATFQCELCPGIMYPDWWFRAERATP